MSHIFQDTAFGRLVHLASGRRIFKVSGEVDPAQLEKYQLKKTTYDSDASRSPHRNDQEDAKGDTEKGSDVELVDWVENDPDNPRNWSSGYKVFVTFQICFLTTSIYIGSAIYTAGLEGIVHDFGVSEVAALLGLTLFVLGYAIGPMFLSALSEVPYFGRTPIYIITGFMFVFLNFAVVYAQNFGMLLAFRFITGFIGSPVLATGGATIADLYVPQKQVYGIAIWGISAVCGPALGPLVGGFAAESEGWQWTIWELIWLSGVCVVFLFVFLPETSSSNILYRRTMRYRKLTGNPNLKCQSQIEAEGMTGAEITQMILIRPFTLSFTEPICFFLNSYIALIYALLYLWFESFPIAFQGIYHFNPGLSGLAFLGILIGALVTIGPFVWYVRKYMEPLFNEDGKIKPEYRLRPAFVGAFFIPVCLFWFGWSARPSIHWIMPIIGSALFPVGAFLLFMAVLSYLGDAYPKYVASVYAGNDLMRSTFGAAFPLFANAMFTTLGLDWGNSLLGFLSILFIPIPFVLYFYGERIRRRSKMAAHDI